MDEAPQHPPERLTVAAEKLLDRDMSAAVTRDVREVGRTLLREVVDEGIRVFERCSKSATGRDENIGLLFPFLQLIELLDGAEVVLDGSSVVGSNPILRAAFEALLTGSRGTRVRLFQKRSGGLFYRAFWVPSRGVDRKCLGTADRAEAERLGKALLGALLKGDEIESSRALPLGTLGFYYRTRSVVYQGLSERARKEHDARMKILVAFIGKECDVRGLTQEDQIAFVRKRLAGRIFLGTSDKGKERLTAPVRQRSAQADIEVLRAILRWATTYRVREGLRLLDRNPFDGVRLPSRGTNPRRPVATHERFVETRRAIGRLRSEAESDLELRKWLKLELALVLAEATGRRLGSFRQLRWNDIDFKTDTILWRAEADKKRKEWRVPMPQALRDELRSFRVKLGGAFGGLLFPSESDPEIPIRRDVLAKWLQQAERRAGLQKLDGSLWHAYRRAWATSRKELPTADVAAAGGWSDVATLLRCYQQPDEATMLSVMSHPRKILDRVSGRN